MRMKQHKHLFRSRQQLKYRENNEKEDNQVQSKFRKCPSFIEKNALNSKGRKHLPSTKTIGMLREQMMSNHDSEKKGCDRSNVITDHEVR